MVLKQSALQRNRSITWKALCATCLLVLGIELYGYLHDAIYHSVIAEYAIVLTACFVLVFTYLWLTSKRNLQVHITNNGLEIIHDEDSKRFCWHEVKKINHPTFTKRNWTFEFKHGKALKLETRHFNKKQIDSLNCKLNQLFTKNTPARQIVPTIHPQ